jgi:succinyl-CoA synthetase alpha subunit
MIFVPPPFAADAIVEAADARRRVIACITEGIPDQRHDPVKAFLAERQRARRPSPDRPNCPGSSRRAVQDRDHAGRIHSRGRSASISRSGP